MAFLECGVLVPGPNHRIPDYGLLSVADPLFTPRDRHWESTGIQWHDDLCSDPSSIAINCEPMSEPKPTVRSDLYCCASPFVVLASYDCPPVGRPADEAFDVARRRLEALEDKAVERAFWTGMAQDGSIVNPSLAFGNTACGIVPEVLTEECALPPVAAMAALENALADCLPGLGVIHMSPGLATYYASHELLVKCGNDCSEAGEWRTPRGNKVAIGSGYPGSGPGGSPPVPGTAWMYGTGPVIVARGEIFMNPERRDQAINRQINSETVWAERVYSVGFSCCLIAVAVTLCACCS